MEIKKLTVYKPVTESNLKSGIFDKEIHVSPSKMNRIK